MPKKNSEGERIKNIVIEFWKLERTMKATDLKRIGTFPVSVIRAWK